MCLYTPTCITSVVPPIHIDQLRKVYALDSLCTVIVLEEVFYIPSVDHINDSFGHNVGGVCSVSLFVKSFPVVPFLFFACSYKLRDLGGWFGCLLLFLVDLLPFFVRLLL